MSDGTGNCYICSRRGLHCTESIGRILKSKGIRTLIKYVQIHNHDAQMGDLDESMGQVWVSEKCYKQYTDTRRVNLREKNDECHLQPNDSFERRSRHTPFDYKKHCLLCEKDLDFDLARKNPTVARYQISEINTVIKKKCQIHQTLRNIGSERKDPLSIEIIGKLNYASCIRSSDAKYHRDCMQRYMSNVSVCTKRKNYKNLNESKNTVFDSFCNWYESHPHETTSSLTLFDVQQWMENNSENGETYSIKQISRKLSQRFGSNGSDVRFTSVEGLPRINSSQRGNGQHCDGYSHGWICRDCSKNSERFVS